MHSRDNDRSSKPPLPDGGILRKGGTDHADRRESLKWLAENGETESLRKKAREMLEGKRSSYEIFRDPEMGELVMKGIKRLEEVMKKEGIDINDPTTHPTRDELAALEKRLSTSADGQTTESAFRRSHFDRRARVADNEYDARFGAGGRSPQN